ncbi:MAG: TolC family protein [Halioglobus sp.]|nr:TolC family protein [Halioglobus sp.]MCB1729063.1 TolC family protein [Halieaceae bacterium]
MVARLRVCLLGACLLFYAELTSAQQGLTLQEASRRSVNNSPELQIFQWRLQAMEGLRQTAGLRPQLGLGIRAENLLGTGEYSGTERAEYTLSLSSIIELGGKRQSRLGVADSRYALAEIERRAQALDLLGRVTQRFVTVLALQEKLQLSQEATRLAGLLLQSVRQRVEQGATPDAERLRAQAALTQAELAHSAIEAELASGKMSLATLWGADEVDFGALSGDLYASQAARDFDALFEQVAASPAIQLLATEARLRQAELELVRSQSTSNLGWSFGVKQLEESGDSAFTAGMEIPLFSGARNKGDIKAAMAARTSVDYRKQASLLELRARLYAAWRFHQQAVAATQQLRQSVLPALEVALVQTREAYERGRYRFVDLVDAQQELLHARLAAIDAASAALLNQALIEQLTAEPLAAVDQSAPASSE